MKLSTKISQMLAPEVVCQEKFVRGLWQGSVNMLPIVCPNSFCGLIRQKKNVVNYLFKILVHLRFLCAVCLYVGHFFVLAQLALLHRACAACR